MNKLDFGWKDMTLGNKVFSIFLFVGVLDFLLNFIIELPFPGLTQFALPITTCFTLWLIYVVKGGQYLRWAFGIGILTFLLAVFVSVLLGFVAWLLFTAAVGATLSVFTVIDLEAIIAYTVTITLIAVAVSALVPRKA